jgi:hypothetical protein
MFATTFYLEREPLSLGDLPGALVTWAQNAGGVAALALLVWCIAWFVGQRNKQQAVVDLLRPTPLMIAATVIAGVLYLLLGLMLLGYNLGAVGLVRWLPSGGTGGPSTVGDKLLTAGGAFALVAVSIPIVTAFFGAIRWRRIWALARVSLKEALRKRVVLVFAGMALIFLFADWFVSYKAENQIRNYVRVVYWSIMPLFLLTAGLLGAFSIPNDVKNQVIHTVVTKPVEKFEIVLGRLIGYGLLLTVGLAVIGGLSLIYVLRGVNPDAAFESQKARVPLYGQLGFLGTKGDSVGREWDYRKYISGPQPGQSNAPHQYAYWAFSDLPAELGERTEPVVFEFTFDIFRLNRGQEGKGIYCTFTLADGRLSPLEVEQTVAKVRTERDALQAELNKKALTTEEREKAQAQISDDLVRKYAVYEIAGVEVTDYHTQELKAPPALFKRLTALETESPRKAKGEGGGPGMMNVLVNVDRISVQQMLGVARRDFYLLADDRSFEVNFLKGIVGMWCMFMLILGVAIACSTYLSGVISWLCTMFLFGAGLFVDYIQQLAEGKSVGGGPLESAYRLMTHAPLATNIEATPTTSILLGADDAYRWVLRRFLNLIPDVTRFDLHHYVANGFDIPWTQVLLADNILPLVAYLVPWGILAFYLMKFREIANPT